VHARSAYTSLPFSTLACGCFFSFFSLLLVDDADLAMVIFDVYSLGGIGGVVDFWCCVVEASNFGVHSVDFVTLAS